jgi:catechol 2,3-dioxygenase-like lactoylglutathione lyase family enzyme
MRFRYSCLFVPDVPRAVTFYREAFGFELRYMHPSRGYAELETGATLLAFTGEAFLRDAALLGDLAIQPNRPDAAPAGAHLAFVTDDIERDWARAVSAGAVVVRPPDPKPWGQTAGYLRDPDGVVIELCTPSPRDGAQ